MIETFQNLETNEFLTISDSTMLQSAAGLFDVQKSREYSAGAFGGSIPLSGTLAQKVFSLNFKSGDFSGNDAMKISRFFSTSNGFFRMTADYLKDNHVDFTVVASEVHSFNGSNGVDVTCQAKYGDFVDEQTAVILSTTMASGASFSGGTYSFTNSFTDPVSIRVSLQSATPVTFRTGVNIAIRKGTATTAPQISTVSGKYDETGTLTTFTGLKYAVDTWEEIIEGSGVVIPSGTTFWKLKSGESTTIRVLSFIKPIVENAPLTLTIEAISLKQKKDF